MSTPPRRLRLALALLAAAAACRSEGAPTGAGPKSSPFLPPAAAGAPAAAAGETLEFTGVSSIGKRTDLIFHDKGTKKSHWIGIGETKEGITVLSYDDRREQAQVKWNGAQKTLPLRKGGATGAGGAGARPAAVASSQSSAANPPGPALVMGPAIPPQPTVAPPPVAPAKPPGPPIPEAQLKQETEARMLVSDLLEIGMAQRKAYEEAQRKAAESTPNPAAAPTAAPKP